jgi:hypothetical protein
MKTKIYHYQSAKRPALWRLIHYLTDKKLHLEITYFSIGIGASTEDEATRIY